MPADDLPHPPDGPRPERPARPATDVAGPRTDPADPAPGSTPSGRVPMFLLAGAAVIAVAGIAAAASCAPPSPPPSPPAATATGGAGPVPATTGPVITAFQVIDDVSCSGATASVPVSWATRDTRSVGFEVDNGPVGAGYALSGIGAVPVPCDGATHRVVLVASGEGQRVAVARQVNTSGGPPPAASPAVRGFDLLDDVTCTGSSVGVPAAWTTQNAQAVTFSVDGQPLSAGAGFPVSGAGDVAVPCDGRAHTVTLTATGTGPAASLSRSVNTTTSSSGAATTPAVPATPASTAPAAPTTG